MRKWIPRLALLTAVLLALAVGWGALYLSRAVPVGTAYFAKVLCSGVFVSGRDPGDVLAVDLALDHPLTAGLEVDVDRESRSAAASLGGFFEQTAVFRDGLGCTLAIGATPDELRAQVARAGREARPEPADARDLPWPDGDLLTGEPPGGVDRERLAAALDRAFEEPDPARPRRTRAVVVVHDGRLVAERYAPGFEADMPLTGWSMTKSVTNALVGILVRRGLLELGAPAPVAEWRADGDPRGAITLDRLLRMSSGLEFEERYGDPGADVQQMLFRRHSAAALAAAKPLRTEPGGEWYYSSGTSNIVARIVRRAVEAAGEDPLTFPRRALFDRIGMRRAVIEPDASGSFVGSSFSYATARGWARLGLLYLRDGMWNGERILPEGWVEYTTTPAPGSPDGRYGAHFWLNAGDGADGAGRRWPELPADLYFMSGYEGQDTFVLPSKRAVVVRLGMSQAGSSWDPAAFLADVLAALP